MEDKPQASTILLCFSASGVYILAGVLLRVGLQRARLRAKPATLESFERKLNYEGMEGGPTDENSVYVPRQSRETPVFGGCLLFKIVHTKEIRTVVPTHGQVDRQ